MMKVKHHYSEIMLSGWLMWCVLISSHWCSFATDCLLKGDSIRDGEFVVSAGEKFAMGFFSPPGSTSRYVGIWYNHAGSSLAVVWLANRGSPIVGNDGVLAMKDDGNLVVEDGNGSIIWSTNVTVASTNSTAAILLDNGDFVIKDIFSEARYLWHSFSWPTDTLIHEMPFYVDPRGVVTRVFSSWRSEDDPARGNYSMGTDSKGSPQIVIWEGNDRRWRSGHWTELGFTGISDTNVSYMDGLRLVTSMDKRNRDAFFTLSPLNKSSLIKLRITWDGIRLQEVWDENRYTWKAVASPPADECDNYNYCGTFAKCNQMEAPKCSCVEGFVPKDADQWSAGNWFDGCYRRTELLCEDSDNGDGLFFRVEHVKLPDFVDYVGPEDVRSCEKLCLKNCSCIAYAFASGLGCMIWRGNLVDIQQFGKAGSTLFVRVARSELGPEKNIRTITISIAAAVATATLFISASTWLLCKRKRKRQGTQLTIIPCEDKVNVEEQQEAGSDLTMYSWSEVVAATENFSDRNKIRRGGFGYVYKGTLPCGKELAIKRLARVSTQGFEQFKNEMQLIAKLQHRNLVRLLGYCTEEDEKMLVYEYMPNNSLDTYLSDPKKGRQLNWSERFNIIGGIARGLLYLHRDSRFKIIHRDLKASNILLDEDMNPKISDFGMARIFETNQNEASTIKVVGTYGYMAPEYAMEGLFSMKSDVYSFCVLLLEIITGQKNSGFRSTDYINIVCYARDFWEGGRAIELIDPSISESCCKEQGVRCIHVGMLCVQDRADDRPDMQTLVLMLESQTGELPLPTRPIFTCMGYNSGTDSWNGPSMYTKPWNGSMSSPADLVNFSS